MSGVFVRTLLDTNERKPTLPSFNNKEDILSVHLRSLRSESSGLTAPGAQIFSGNSLAPPVSSAFLAVRFYSSKFSSGCHFFLSWVNI